MCIPLWSIGLRGVYVIVESDSGGGVHHTTKKTKPKFLKNLRDMHSTSKSYSAGCIIYHKKVTNIIWRKGVCFYLYVLQMQIELSLLGLFSLWLFPTNFFLAWMGSNQEKTGVSNWALSLYS